MHWSVRFALLSAVMICAWACSTDDVAEALAGLGERCLINSDCSDSNICVFQTCHQPCNTSEDCPVDPATGEHFNCFVGDKPESVCQLVVECEYHSDCEGHQVCASDRKCRDQCVTDQDCVPHQVCVSGTCAEEHELVDGALPETDKSGTEGTPCAYASDCDGDLVCHNGFCNVECKGDKDCATGERCVNDVCLGPSSSGSGGSGAGGSSSGSGGSGGAGGSGGSSGGGGVGGSGGGTSDTCSDHVTDNGETDVDCGGPCLGCPTGSTCTLGSDCQNGVCGGNQICQVPSCSDTVRNGAETGTDCGGPQCNPCPGTEPCTVPADCVSGVCQGGICQNQSCGDGIKNQGETATDCGGPCGGCLQGQPCNIGGDCAESVCSGGFCAAPTCLDGVSNGLETGTDCGGNTCGPCGVGAGCDVNSDCASGSCESGGGVCLYPACDDTVQNGFESDVDCGGQCPDRCADGDGCFFGSDCDSGICAGNLCQAAVELTVGLLGTGAGAITSNPAGINCGNDCSEIYAQGAQVTLTAIELGNSTFQQWSDPSCAGNPTCPVNMDQAKTVTATFDGPGGGGPTWLQEVGQVPWGSTYPTLASDDQGRMLVVADFVGGAYLPFGAISANSQDVALVTYAADGTPVGQRRVGGNGSQHLSHAAFFPNGDFALTAITDTADVAFGNPGVTIPCNAGGVYLGRYGFGLGLQWEECVAGSADTTGIAVDPNDGSLVVIGRFTGDQDFDPGGGTVLSSAGGHDWFVARYDGSTGALVTAKRYGGPSSEWAIDVAIDAVTGDVVVAGNCVGAQDFDGLPVPGIGSYDICLVSLDAASLDAQWVRMIGDTVSDHPTTVGLFSNGDILLAGNFEGSMIVDGARPPLQSQGAEDVFLAIFDAQGNALREISFGSVGTEDYYLGYLYPSVFGRITSNDEVAVAGLCRNADFDLGGGPVGCSQDVESTWWGRFDANLSLQLDEVELNAARAGDLVAPGTGGVRLVGTIAGGPVTFGGSQTASDNTYLVRLDL